MKINRLINKPLKELEFSVVDVETTGMSSEFNKIIDIGIVKIKNLEIIDTWETLLDPKQDLDPWITYYTSLRNEHLKGKSLFKDVAHKIDSLLKDSVFVAHNVEFDHSFVKKEMKDSNLELDGPKLCTVKLSRRFLPELENYHLDAVSAYFNIKIQNRHRALPDAYATAQVFIRYLKDAAHEYQVKDFFGLEKLQWNIKHENGKNLGKLFELEKLT